MRVIVLFSLEPEPGPRCAGVVVIVVVRIRLQDGVSVRFHTHDVDRGACLEFNCYLVNAHNIISIVRYPTLSFEELFHFF